MRDDRDNADLRSRSDVARERKGNEKRLAELALALVGLSKKQLNKLELQEGLAEAVEEARRFPSHAARARQLRVVRRELRGSDSLAIAAAVDGLVNPQGGLAPAAREAQRWADRFLAEGTDAVESFLTEYEQADRQRLKGLLRNARKAAASKAARARKTLVAAIQEHVQQASD